MGNFFTDLFSSKPAEEAAAARRAGLQQAQTQANATLDSGQTGADALYGRAYQPFASLYSQAAPGTSAYADASGANGAEGLARAKTLFQSSPGYSGGLTTGVDQLARTAAARGDTGGNLSADVIKFASDYDSQKYNNYLQGLAPWLGTATGAAAGGAGVLGSQAGADLGVAQQKAGIDYSAQSGIGDANAQAALAPYSASQNFWNALMGGAQLALKASGAGGFAGK